MTAHPQVKPQEKEGEKPLFIPLKAEYYDAFVAGTKSAEFRKHGPRWNSTTCYSGRKVILSRGYGKKNRLSATILSCGVTPINPPAFTKIYGENVDCWCINLVDIRKDTTHADTGEKR